MVVFIEIAEQMNGSCNVETESKGDETNGWKGSSKSKDETASAILATLPFEISEWQVFHYEDFTLTKLACGFFGDVYKAEHVATKEIMCLKVNKPDLGESDSELGEITLLHRLSHPNLLRFMGICLQSESGQVHLLTEFMNGGSLEELLMNHEENLYWSERLYIAQDIAKGIAYLHKNRIIHRDLASKNCLIRKANRWKYAVVGDLGLATEIPKDGLLQVVGSPYNMAPEMMRGEQYNVTADVFSYGIVLCEIIGRVQADPDELPRTTKFGLDVDKFQHMVGDCPLELLQVAICCCQLDPHSRPEFTSMVKILDLILSAHTRRPQLEDWKEHKLIITPHSPTETDNQNNNHINNDVKDSITGTTPTIVVSQEQNPSHKHRDKRRASSILGKYKLFNSATEDLLKTTPGKLKSFFSNILRHREIDVHLRRRKKSKENRKRQSSCSELKRRSHNPDGRTDVLSASWNLQESKSETYSLASSISCPGTPDVDRADGYLQTSLASKSARCDLHSPKHLVTTTDSENILRPLSLHSDTDTESDLFSFSSSMDSSPRTFENDTFSCSSSAHSRSSNDGDVMDSELDKPRRHSSPMHVFEQLRNLRLERRSATYLVSEVNSVATPDTAQASGGGGETNHVQQILDKPKTNRTKSPFSFLSRKTCRAKTDPH